MLGRMPSLAELGYATVQLSKRRPVNANKSDYFETGWHIQMHNGPAEYLDIYIFFVYFGAKNQLFQLIYDLIENWMKNIKILFAFSRLIARLLSH